MARRRRMRCSIAWSKRMRTGDGIWAALHVAQALDGAGRPQEAVILLDQIAARPGPVAARPFAIRTFPISRQGPSGR
jgi:hypothetical protein